MTIIFKKLSYKSLYVIYNFFQLDMLFKIVVSLIINYFS